MGRGIVATWNLDGHQRQTTPEETLATRERLVRCIRSLERQLRTDGFDRVVGVFQELPLDFAGVVKEATDGRWFACSQSAAHHVGVVVSAGLSVSGVSPLGAPGAPQRALRFDVTGLVPDGPVRFVGVHWVDRLNNEVDSRERVRLNTHFWPNVRSQWDFPNIRYFVVLGDFNESPQDYCLVSKHYLWAIRDQRDIDGRSKHDDGAPALYNPMWKYLPERPLPPFGTYEKLVSKHSGVRWWLFDQIVLSRDALSFVESVDVPTTLDELVLHKNGYPDRENVSDHLPVLAMLKV